MLYVVPNFSKIFSDMGQTLPLPTLMLIKVSGLFSSYWWAILAAIALVIFMIRSYGKTAEGKIYLDNRKLKIPVLNKLTMKMIISRFSRTLGTLLQSGVPILEAIRISRDVIDNDAISKKLFLLEEGVSKGRGISQPMKESGVFPPIFNQMVIVGEEAGRAEETFLLIAERFEVETRNLI